MARLVAPHLSSRLGQSVVVDNRPGGGTSIGAKAVVGAEPDGYTLLYSNSPTHLIAPLVNKSFTYDPIKDFVPIATVGSSANVIVISPSVPARSVQEFVAYAKANPGKLNFGFGQGTQPQLVGEMFKLATGTDIASIPYKGGAQAITDLLGGTDSHEHRNRVDFAPAHPRRQAQGARHHQHDAEPRSSGGADHGGERLSERDVGLLLRHLRPRRPAGRRHRQAQQRGQ